jgi:hypothetical protein
MATFNSYYDTSGRYGNELTFITNWSSCNRGYTIEKDSPSQKEVYFDPKNLIV